MTCDVAVSFCVCVPFLGEKLFFSLSIFFPSNFQLPSLHLRTIEKKVAFLLPKVEFSPSNPTSKKIIAIKKFHKKHILSMILLAIILLPLKYQFSAMAKLRQFSHFLQQINKSVLYPFSKIQRELRVYFCSFVNQISINRKLRSDREPGEEWEGH